MGSSLVWYDQLRFTGLVGVRLIEQRKREADHQTQPCYDWVLRSNTALFICRRRSGHAFASTVRLAGSAVEVSHWNPLDRGQSGPVTGTVNPGVIWSGKYFQVGAEAVIPINSRTGNDVGFIAQLHFYLDDLFPHSIGRPLFGGNK